MFFSSDMRQKGRCFRCSQEFVKTEGENICSRCSSEVFPSGAQSHPNVINNGMNGTPSNTFTLQPLSNLIDPLHSLPSFSPVLPPFRALPPLSFPSQTPSSASHTNNFPFPPPSSILPQSTLPQINELNNFPKQTIPMNNFNGNNNNNNNVNSMNINNIPMNNPRTVVNSNINNNYNPQNEIINNNGFNNHLQNHNNPNSQKEGPATVKSEANNTSNSNTTRINNGETTLSAGNNPGPNNNNNNNNNNINISNNSQIVNNQNNTSSSNNSNGNISPNHQRILQTVHLQHIQNLIEIQRTMHLQNPPYPHSHSPDIARIVNEINTVMHNHSLQHFQALASALQNNRNIHNAHFETLFPSNFNGNNNNEMSPQEYSQILADLFERQQGNSGPPPTDKTELSKLPQLIFSEEDLKDEKQCAVCKELFQEDDTAVELPCSHPFHLDCILPWLTTRNTCPCCRFQLKPAEETNNRNDENNNMSDSDGEGDGDGDGDYEIADSESDFSSDDGDDSNTFTTSYVYNN